MIAEPERYSVNALVAFAKRLLESVGLSEEQSEDVAAVLVEGDLLGHDTHGLALLSNYLSQAESGRMRVDAQPIVLASRHAIATWDGLRLPGPWLVKRALRWAASKVAEYGSSTVVIRRSHHIGCLAAYLAEPARTGLLVLISCSDPANATVAPFGGRTAVFSPNPIAVGIPTSGDPIMVDISASVTTNGMSKRLASGGQKGEHHWWMDAEGHLGKDPSVMFQQPPGTVLPLGGLDSGHKGYGLALMIEALTGGLAGYGRADIPEGLGATVFVQLHNTAAYAGVEEFNRQMDWITEASHASAPRLPDSPVRLPGERGLACRADRLVNGIYLSQHVIVQLAQCAEKYNVSLPSPI